MHYKSRAVLGDTGVVHPDDPNTHTFMANGLHPFRSSDHPHKTIPLLMTFSLTWRSELVLLRSHPHMIQAITNGKRNKLEEIDILDDSGAINEVARPSLV